MQAEFFSGFYAENFGNCAKIPREELMLWLKRAAAELSLLTMGRSEENIGDNMAMCICEIAEHLYESSARSHIESENNDGYSVKYKNRDRKIAQIAKRYLAGTGLLYRGDEL